MKKEKKKREKKMPKRGGRDESKGGDDHGDDDDDDEDDDDEEEEEEEVEEVDPALKVQAARFLLGAVMLDGVAWGVGKIALVEVVRLAYELGYSAAAATLLLSASEACLEFAASVRSTKKACNSSTMTISAPIALLGRECYAYYYCFRRMRTFTAPNAHICSREFLNDFQSESGGRALPLPLVGRPPPPPPRPAPAGAAAAGEERRGQAPPEPDQASAEGRHKQ